MRLIIRQSIKHVLLVFVLIIAFVGCKQTGSLQAYFVDHEEAPNFISQDIPVSILKLDDSIFNDKQKEAYKSVRRLNLLGYNDTISKTFNAELTKIKTILNDKKYNDLMEFNHNKSQVNIKYIGTDDEADEFVMLASSKAFGFAVIRILGKDMTPDKMITLISILQKVDIGKNEIQNIIKFFK